MALIIEKPVTVFDTEQVKRGYLLWGKHRTWSEGRAGFVTAVTKDCLTVQYYPGIGNVTNHFMIPVSEAADGQWEIRWSSDMSQVWECNIQENGGTDIEVEEAEKGAEDNAAGRTDL